MKQRVTKPAITPRVTLETQTPNHSAQNNELITTTVKSCLCFPALQGLQGLSLAPSKRSFSPLIPAPVKQTHTHTRLDVHRTQLKFLKGFSARLGQKQTAELFRYSWRVFIHSHSSSRADSPNYSQHNVPAAPKDKLPPLTLII